MTKQMTILQVAQMAFFSKHGHFLSFFCHFRIIFDIFHIFEKISPKWQKNDKQKWQKKRHQKRTKNDKINIWTISRVWLRVSSKATTWRHGLWHWLQHDFLLNLHHPDRRHSLRRQKDQTSLSHAVRSKDVNTSKLLRTGAADWQNSTLEPK